MVSPELLRRYPFFSGFAFEQLDELAMVADELAVPARHWFFQEGDTLDTFFLLLEGSVCLTHNIPDHNALQTMTMQITGNMITVPVAIGTLNHHELFGWSALIPPNTSTAGAQAATDCRVITFDAAQLRPILEADCRFSYLVTLKAAQVIRERLRMQRIESLADHSEDRVPL